jgi:poly-D-alanine transfer protein DltD
MNLEAIEQRTLNFLKQSVSPLVPFDKLAEYLRRSEDLGPFTDAELMDFLRNHELFEVVEPLQLEAQGIPEASLEETGFQLSPYVILTTRVPTERQMAEHMMQQLRSLAQVLNAAMIAAKEQGQSEKAQILIKLQARAQELQERVARFV